jgi:hypothetical protein
VSFVIAALLAVWVADRIAAEIAGSDLVARRLQTLLVVGGRVVAGWAAGMAYRLQLAPRGRSDPQLRLWLGVPLGALAAWPLVRTGLPDVLARAIPGWAVELGALAPVAGLLLGLTLALAVTRSGR